MLSIYTVISFRGVAIDCILIMNFKPLYCGSDCISFTQTVSVKRS